MATKKSALENVLTMLGYEDDERAIVAKYCIQDCNLVHELLLKLDIITGLVEMAKLCSVPMNYLVMRGQGIKLTSYISKKCREKGYLIPCIDKDESEDGYEGAIVLPPKSDLYFDESIIKVTGKEIKKDLFQLVKKLSIM